MGWLVGLLKPLGSYVINFFVEYLFKKLKAALNEWKKKKEEDTQNQQAVEDYLAVVNKPDATREERKNAEQDYLNK